MLRLILSFFFSIFSFFRLSYVIQREICVKAFSATTAPRVLTFGTNVGYDLLFCVKETQSPAVYHPSLFFQFPLSPINFSVKDFSAPMRDSLQILCTPSMREAKYIVGQKTKLLRIYFPSFSFFPYLTPL